MTILVIAEHDNQHLKPATLNTITAASQLPGNIVVLVSGKACNSVSRDASRLEHVSKVLEIDDKFQEHHLAENLAGLVEKISKDYEYILAPATTFGKNILPRIAALLDVSQVSDVTCIVSEDIFKHPIYAGNAIETIQSGEAIKVLTIRSTAFHPCGTRDIPCIVESISETVDLGLSEFIDVNMPTHDRPELTQAKIVVSGGRGLQHKDNFQMLEELASKLGAAIGASRAAVDADYISNDHQVGQTGKIIAPNLYIAIGISGAIQHSAGMKDSKVIVAINKDEKAPIFKMADYGLVGDLFDIVPQLIKLL